MAREILCFIAFLLCQLSAICGDSRDEYLRQRQLLDKKERQSLTGGSLTLNSAEQKINTMLMDLKSMEIHYAMEPGGVFPPAMHFFHAKPFIEETEIFKVIRAMPKGAVLHIHDASMASVKWLISNATYELTCYTCFEAETGQQLFRFFKSKPHMMKLGSDCDWVAVNDLRGKASNPQLFDQELYRNLTLIVDDPTTAYPTQTAIWERFGDLFSAAFGLVSYAPMWRNYYYEALAELYEDGVQYVEIRSLLPELYEADGSTHSIDWTVEVYRNTTKAFMREHPDFAGAKVIYTISRHSNKSDVASAIQEAIRLRKKYPDFVAGFDLVSREDTGYPLVYFLDELLYPSQHGIDLPYFFHAGETDWQGEDVDENLLDALLLNTSRIGHGYALAKHPVLQKYLREKDIAIEVNPISNQVLKLVDDLRNHPVSVLMASGFPMVISPDDPSLWGATGLSYDMYEAFMGLGGGSADLATLKKLAMDSIKYSALSPDGKSSAMKLWQSKWDAFVKTMIHKYKL